MAGAGPAAAPTRGQWREAVLRSLITLKALTYAPTGGIVAAPTTSLPEQLGGVRNWDYRYCWLRDATFTLLSRCCNAGYLDEAGAWRDWLLRAVAGDPAEMQIMYGLAGERRLTEMELDWLPGYEGAQAGARRQRRLEAVPARRLRRGARRDVPGAPAGPGSRRRPAGPWARRWSSSWRRPGSKPDEGIWEVRGPRRHFTHSKVMAWVALDRGGQGGRELRPATGRSTAGASCRDAIHARGLPRGLQRRTRTPSCSPTARRSWTPAC